MLTRCPSLYRVVIGGHSRVAGCSLLQHSSELSRAHASAACRKEIWQTLEVGCPAKPAVACSSDWSHSCTPPLTKGAISRSWNLFQGCWPLADRLLLRWQLLVQGRLRASQSLGTAMVDKATIAFLTVCSGLRPFRLRSLLSSDPMKACASHSDGSVDTEDEA